MAGVTVELIDSKGNVTTTVTDANGYYSFGQQPAGNYTVSIVTPSGDMQVPLSPTTVNVTLGARDVSNLSAVNFLVEPTTTTTSPGKLALDALFANVDDVANLLQELAL